jgi:hypothetical protein
VNLGGELVTLEDYSLPPLPNPLISIQKAGTSMFRANYAYLGQDQLVWVGLSKSPYNPGTYAIGGKVDIKPSGRPLKIHYSIMQNCYNPISSYDYTQIKSTVPNCSGRTFFDAMKSLVGNNAYGYNYSHSVTYGIPNPYGATMTFDQVHAFMASKRKLSLIDSMNFVPWKMDVLILSSDIQEILGQARGVMFDKSNYGINVAPYREGVALIGPLVKETNLDPGICNGAAPSNSIRLLTLNIMAHEIAHALNMDHSWAQVPPATPCNTIEKGTGLLPSDYTFTFSNQNTIRWYQNGPEAFVKPGLYGIDWLDTGELPVSFIRADGTSFSF